MCALRVVGTLSLDAHVLALVVPWHLQRSLGRLQRVFRIESDAKDNSAVADKYLEEKLCIALLPRWTLTLLGDTYVVRRPLRADWNHAWFMTEADSQDMDQKIVDALRGTHFGMNPTATGLAKGRIQEAIQRILEEEAKQCMEK